MFRFFKTVAIVAVMVGLVWLICPEPELRHPPGVRVDRDPVQLNCEPHRLGKFRGYDLTAVAGYKIEARVLHTKRYWADHDDLVPYDVALGWGPMSDQRVLDHLDVSQSNRFFFYQWQNQPPIPLPEIIRHAANNHVIAANPGVATAIRRLRRGQFVEMRGYLVNVSRPDGFHWNTSTTREDNGNGACEVFYVEAITVSNEPV